MYIFRWLTLIAVVFIPVFVVAQSESYDMTNMDVTIKADNQALGTVIAELMFKFNVPIGFEESHLDSGHSDFTFATSPLIYSNPRLSPNEPYSEKNTSAKRVFSAKAHLISIDAVRRPLKEVLDRIVFQMDNYQWEVRDSVINIYPSKGRVQTSQDFLALKISNYRFEKGNSIGSIEESLFRLPEVQHFLASNNLKYVESRWIAGDLKKPTSEVIVGKDITLLELLNKICRTKGGGWILRQQTSRGSSTKFIDLDI